jgi:calcineurin-like phosphoesterase family protein
MSLSASQRLDHPTLPEGQLLYAVGDIHGRADLLGDMLLRIAADARASGEVARRTLVFLGDYVDRGPDSRGVIETLIGGLPQGFDAHFLKGNHEAILLGFLDDPSRLEHWLVNGGDATMLSYGVDTERLDRLAAPPGTWRNAFAEALPEAHLRFLKSLKLSVVLGDYLFVHAGLRPGVPLAAQSEADLIWIRAPFLDHAEPFGKIVVHGHTPGNAPVTRPNRIGIDTGACFTNRLTALRLQDDSRDFLQT